MHQGCKGHVDVLATREVGLGGADEMQGAGHCKGAARDKRREAFQALRVRGGGGESSRGVGQRGGVQVWPSLWYQGAL